MRLALIEVDGRRRVGVAAGQGYAVLDGPDSLGAVLASSALLARAGALAGGPAGVAVAQARLLPLLDPSARAFCVGLNYQAHAEEHGREKPKPNPGFFIRTASSLVAHGDALRAPRASEQYDFEGELCVVIGRAGRHIEPGRAMEHVAGYTCLMDGSVRDYQRNCVAAGKNFEASGAVGPWMVTADEVPDVSALRLRTLVSGTEMQRSSLDRLIHPIPKVIAYLSGIFHLQPGDLIATGSPDGVGQHRAPPRWLRPGDAVTVEIPGVATLSNPVLAEE